MREPFSFQDEQGGAIERPPYTCTCARSNAWIDASTPARHGGWRLASPVAHAVFHVRVLTELEFASTSSKFDLDHGLHALAHTRGCSFHARKTPAPAAESSKPASRIDQPSRYRRSNDRTSSATSSLNATGEKPADRMRRAHETAVSRRSMDSDAGQETRSTMARPAPLSSASLSLLVLGKLSSSESM